MHGNCLCCFELRAITISSLQPADTALINLFTTCLILFGCFAFLAAQFCEGSSLCPIVAACIIACVVSAFVRNCTKKIACRAV